MKCFINCTAGLVFLIANLYCMFSVDKSEKKENFQNIKFRVTK